MGKVYCTNSIIIRITCLNIFIKTFKFTIVAFSWGQLKTVSINGVTHLNPKIQKKVASSRLLIKTISNQKYLKSFVFNLNKPWKMYKYITLNLWYSWNVLHALGSVSRFRRKFWPRKGFNIYRTILPEWPSCTW